MADGGSALVLRWDQWVRELEAQPLDQYEYLGALQCRDDLEAWLQIHGDEGVWDAAEEVDARFEEVTFADQRFAARFADKTGRGWWWARFPADPASQEYIVQDWELRDREDGNPATRPPS